MSAELLPLACRAELLRRARAALPEEACGTVLGCVGEAPRVVEFVPGRNLHPTPRSGFELDPAAIAVAERRARRSGLAVIGFYHSHPDRPAIPSHSDRAGAWEGFLALIAGIDGGRAEVRAYRLLGGVFVELDPPAAPAHAFPAQLRSWA